MQAMPPVKPKIKRTRRKLDQVAIDDQKFLDELEAERFNHRIAREADELILCPRCGITEWRVEDKHQVLALLLMNEVLVTIVCRKCKKRLPFVSKADPTEDDEED